MEKINYLMSLIIIFYSQFSPYNEQLHSCPVLTYFIIEFNDYTKQLISPLYIQSFYSFDGQSHKFE